MPIQTRETCARRGAMPDSSMASREGGSGVGGSETAIGLNFRESGHAVDTDRGVFRHPGRYGRRGRVGGSEGHRTWISCRERWRGMASLKRRANQRQRQNADCQRGERDRAAIAACRPLRRGEPGIEIGAQVAGSRDLRRGRLQRIRRAPAERQLPAARLAAVQMRLYCRAFLIRQRTLYEVPLPGPYLGAGSQGGRRAGVSARVLRHRQARFGVLPTHPPRKSQCSSP